MLHLGKIRKVELFRKAFHLDHLQTHIEGVNIHPKSENSRNFTQCDSLLLTGNCSATTIPYVEFKNKTSTIEHEATSSKISEDQLFYCLQRGLDEEEAIALIVNGFVKKFYKLPMEFAVEDQKLLEISLEGRRRMSGNLLEINDLHVNAGDKEILKGLNLSIPFNEIHAIMGLIKVCPFKCFVWK